ncbi:docking protein 1 [Xyrauchen texanus]|uniref:docking protein 1 n=1 Tax=Xyrauchen texanus TaxID=154827 RepID=UPI002241893A|nr:docking protein 1 [Xyrauchen texanus]
MDHYGKRGEVYLQHQRHGEKWKRYWLTLHPASRHGVARLELSEASQERSTVVVRRHPERKVVRLNDCVSVVKLPPHAEACPGENMAAFCVETEEKRLVFAAERESCGEWVEIICNIAFQKHCNSGPKSVPRMEDNQIYMSREQLCEFKVLVSQTEASVGCGLTGQYWLQAGDDMLVLQDLETRKTVLEWPYKLLRRYGQDKMLFSIEAGRRCESGPGTFNFETRQSEEILRLIESAIRQQNSLTVAEGRNSPHSPRSRSPRSPLPRRPDSFGMLYTERTNSPDSIGVSESVYSNQADALVPNIHALSNPLYIKPASLIGLIEPVKSDDSLSSSKRTHTDTAGGTNLIEPVYSNPADLFGGHESVYAQPADAIKFNHTVKIDQSGLQSGLPSHKNDSEPVYSDPVDVIRSGPKVNNCVYASHTDTMKCQVSKATSNNEEQQEPVYSEVYNVTQNSSKKPDLNTVEPVYSVPEVAARRQVVQEDQDNKSAQNKMPEEITAIYSKVMKPPKTPQSLPVKKQSQTQEIVFEDLGMI